jgi:hypothetical protein
VDDFFTRTFQDLVGRAYGPMHIRLIIQPLVAGFLAVRAGLRDAHAGNPPFLWALAFSPGHRRELLRQAWQDIAKLFVMAFVLDLTYQLVALHEIRFGQALPMAIMLAVIPYLLLRAPITRLFGRKRTAKQ